MSSKQQQKREERRNRNNAEFHYRWANQNQEKLDTILDGDFMKEADPKTYLPLMTRIVQNKVYARYYSDRAAGKDTLEFTRWADIWLD